MVTAAFPSFIDVYQAAVQTAYSEQPEANQASFQPEVGTAILRRRTSLSQDLVTFTLRVTSSIWGQIKKFYQGTIYDGTLPFTMAHPRNRTTGTWQFTPGNPPKITAANGPVYDIQLQLRLLDGGEDHPIGWDLFDDIPWDLGFVIDAPSLFDDLGSVADPVALAIDLNN